MVNEFYFSLSPVFIVQTTKWPVGALDSLVKLTREGEGRGIAGVLLT